EDEVGLQREHGETRGGDRAVAVDERGIAEGHLAQDRVTHWLALDVSCSGTGRARAAAPWHTTSMRHRSRFACSGIRKLPAPCPDLRRSIARSCLAAPGCPAGR